MKKLIQTLISLGGNRRRGGIKARPLESGKHYKEKKGEYVFRSLVEKNKLICLNLCEDGRIHLNINCPEIKKWEYDSDLKK